MTNLRSFFSRSTPICSSRFPGIQVYSLPVSTRALATRIPLFDRHDSQFYNLREMYPLLKLNQFFLKNNEEMFTSLRMLSDLGVW
jgi:hypothetical protein